MKKGGAGGWTPDCPSMYNNANGVVCEMENGKEYV